MSKQKYLSAVPQNNPKAGYLAHKDEIDSAIERVLENGQYILGSEVSSFEKEFSSHLNAGACIGVASGTDALEIALKACGVGSGDDVLTVSHTSVATVVAIERCGAKPVLVDIDPRTYTIDPNSLKETLKSCGRAKAVIPVHLYGHPADMISISEIAEQRDLWVIEDTAQAHGASLGGRKIGTWGDLAAFSFYPTKNLGALGDGGAVVTADPNLAERIRSLREYGWKERFVSETPGVNSRLDELQAAILRVKLEYLDEENRRRRQIAQIYNSKLSTIRFTLPAMATGAKPVYHQYVIRSQKRDNLKSFLESHSVSTAIHYPVPIHLQPAYRNRIAMAPNGLKNTEKICKEILSLPIYPQMKNEEVERVCDLIGEWGRAFGGN